APGLLHTHTHTNTHTDTLSLSLFFALPHTTQTHTHTHNTHNTPHTPTHSHSKHTTHTPTYSPSSVLVPPFPAHSCGGLVYSCYPLPPIMGFTPPLSTCMNVACTVGFYKPLSDQKRQTPLDAGVNSKKKENINIYY